MDIDYKKRIEEVVSRGLGMDRCRKLYSPDEYTNLHANILAMDMAAGKFSARQERQAVDDIIKGIDYDTLWADKFLRDPIAWVWEAGDLIEVKNE